jgi:D-lactate dehydrogenase (cytochrome)
LPEAVSAAICSFPSIEAAVRTTIQIIQLGIPIARVELIDRNTVRMVNAYAKLGLREEPMLLMEFHGSPAGVKEQAELVQEIASDHGGNAFEWASTPEERTRLWTARHNAYFAAIQSRPGCRCHLDRHLRADLAPGRLPARLGGRGRCVRHSLLPGRPCRATATSTSATCWTRGNPQERVVAEQLNHQLVTRALALGGTCSGEHGVGLHKMDFLVTEAGDGAVDMMRTIKRALDPHNIMNPGKIFRL